MVRKKVDNRIRLVIEKGVNSGHRSMFVVVGDKGRDQVVILHHMLSKAEIKARPSVLWCYSKELGFSSHRKKRMKLIQKKVASGKLDVNEDDPFELFVRSTTIRYCYYAETHKILGNTYGMCVLQDFEALTPNILARTIETVEGGGIIVILLRSVNSLKQLYTMTMDCHARFRTEAHQDVVGRFNERFILSLGSCDSCIVMDDSLNILPLSSNLASQITDVEPKTGKQNPEQIELQALQESLKDTQPVGALMNCCKTLDQGKALLKFIDAISEKKLDATVSLTAARGRGKSAALGIAMSAAIAFGYSNIYVTSPSPENLTTLFEFVFKGTDALQYQEHTDYEIVQSTNPEFKKVVVRVNFFRDHRQTIQYIHPTDAQKLGQAELLVIDEAAAIPLPLVKSLFGPYLIFLSSTISGYEGTGRSLSLKLIEQLRNSGVSDIKAEKGKATNTVSGRILREITLDESIRYKPGDDVENWLTSILCLDATLTKPITSGCPQPKNCELYYINRDTLFSYHKAGEKFLQQLMSLYVASHYKNSPNDLQLMSDAPAHHLFCLLGPSSKTQTTLPEVLCVIQVCLEGEISKTSAAAGLQRGKSASGDLIPWTLSQQFQDTDFPTLSGARIVRIATHPDYQKMGYGTRALFLLREYYEGKMVDLDEDGDKSKKKKKIKTVQEEDIDLLTESIEPRKLVDPLLSRLSERPPENLDYLGVSYGLTLPLLKFWKANKFVPVYLRQTPNELTGEHSCIMVTLLETATDLPDDIWIRTYFKDFRRRYLSLLGYQFRTFSPSLALSVLQSKYGLISDTAASSGQTKPISPEILKATITPYDMKRLDLYTKNMSDYHVIMDLIPALARFYFLGQIGELTLSSVQSAILLGLGLQHKTVDDLAKEMDVAASQLLGLFVRAIRKILKQMEEVLEFQILDNQIVGKPSAPSMTPVAQSLFTELEEGAKVLKKKQAAELERLKKDDLSQYVIKGSDEAWTEVLTTTPKTKSSTKLAQGSQIVTIKRVGEELEGNSKKKKSGFKEDGKKSFGKGWKKGGKMKSK